MNQSVTNNGNNNVTVNGHNTVSVVQRDGRSISITTVNGGPTPARPAVFFASAALSGLLAWLSAYADYLTVRDLGERYGLGNVLHTMTARWSFMMPGTQIVALPGVKTPLPLFGHIEPLYWHVVVIFCAVFLALRLASMGYTLMKRRFVILPFNYVLAKLNGRYYWLKLRLKCDKCGDPLRLGKRNGKPWTTCGLNNEHSDYLDEARYINEMSDRLKQEEA